MSRRLAASVLLLVVVAAACTGGDDDEARPSVTDPTSTTTTIDVTAVDLGRVGGATTTTIEITGGKAVLGGTAVGPDGAAVGGVVRVERLVGDAVAQVDVLVEADGRWRLDDVKGGRYRVRGWRSPDLVMKKAETLFLGATERKSLDLKLERVGGVTATADVAPNPPVVGRLTELAVLIAAAAVDDQGTVHGEPVPRAIVELIGRGRWRTDSANPAVAGVDGVATWQVRCLEAGTQPLSVRVDTADGPRELSLELPDCAAPVATTTTRSGSTTTAGGSTTTTTRSTTTTAD